MKWVKKHGLLLCRIICILSFCFIIIITLNQKNTLQKEFDECKNSRLEYEKINGQLKDQHKKLKDELKQLDQEKAELDDKIQVLQKKLEEEKKNKEEVVLQVNALKDNNIILEEKLMEKSSEVRQVTVDERITNSITELILDIFDSLEDNDYEKFKSYWDLSDERVNESQPLYWFERWKEHGKYVTKIEFYDQYGTGKGSITDDYFAVHTKMDADYGWMFVGHKKDDKWLVTMID